MALSQKNQGSFDEAIKEFDKLGDYSDTIAVFSLRKRMDGQ